MLYFTAGAYEHFVIYFGVKYIYFLVISLSSFYSNYYFFSTYQMQSPRGVLKRSALKIHRKTTLLESLNEFAGQAYNFIKKRL